MIVVEISDMLRHKFVPQSLSSPPLMCVYSIHVSYLTAKKNSYI